MTKCRPFKFLIIFVLSSLFTGYSSFSQIKKEKFSFTFEGIKYSGVIDLPEKTEPTSMIIIVPGSGKTNFIAGDWFNGLRSQFVQFGFACCVWDKAGCGKSEGVFDYQQSVQSSAKEALAAIKELKRQKIAGSDKIGLWGISRAGFICPLIIQEYPSIAFWISVSGTDSLDNFRYLLETNWRIQGKSESETNLLLSEWDHCSKVLRKGGETYNEFLKTTKDLYQDTFFNSLGGTKPTETDFNDSQNYYEKSGFVFDEASGLQVMVPNFSETLKIIQCPVLAIFGENDSQIPWRKVMSLYKETIGDNMKAKLTIKTLPNCNHTMEKCINGAFDEKLEHIGWNCDGYYEAILNWLKELGFAK
jgi:pimeloyl-ACP methyl ester carboxylesterase